MTTATLSFKQTVSVILVDDDPVFRQGIRTLLGFYSGPSRRRFQVVGEADSAGQALHLISQQWVDLILLDLELIESDGLNFLASIQATKFACKVLVISGHQEDEWVFRVMQLGAHGYLFKSTFTDHLASAVNAVLNQEIYLPTEVATRFFRQFKTHQIGSNPAAEEAVLTEREQEVLLHLIDGQSNQDIARQLYISTATVKAHLTAIYSKLGVSSRTQAIVAAMKRGLIRSC
jgi:DNA-binding NarL/FixJ family response regulator